MRLLILLLCFTYACSDSPTTPDGKLAGVWEGTEFFTIRYDNGAIYFDSDGRQGLHHRKADVSVSGKIVEIAIFDPFFALRTDVLYFRGEIQGDRIPGETWLSYRKDRIPFTFVRVK